MVGIIGAGVVNGKVQGVARKINNKGVEVWTSSYGNGRNIVDAIATEHGYILLATRFTEFQQTFYDLLLIGQEGQCKGEYQTSFETIDPDGWLSFVKNSDKTYSLIGSNKAITKVFCLQIDENIFSCNENK